MGIEYKPAKMHGNVRKRAVDEVVSTVGSMTETNGLVENRAAKGITHLLGENVAKDMGETLAEFKRSPEAYSAVFKDGGLRLRAITAIAEKGRVTDFPTDATEMFNEFEEYMNYSFQLLISPSISLFATWLGIDRKEYDKRMNKYASKKPDLASCMKLCKETIHGFIETQAIDGAIPPAVYLHQNKAYYEAVEAVEIKHTNIADAHVRDGDQIQEAIDALPVAVKRELEKTTE